MEKSLHLGEICPWMQAFDDISRNGIGPMILWGRRFTDKKPNLIIGNHCKMSSFLYSATFSPTCSQVMPEQTNA